ncbi:2OG-Fe(II) oxygenase [Candidatus Kaiserbacteria bacterium]|nr:2OG-Fe(II) oxygenase [Candidatus Kaiserbacteria bacterium]
MLTKFLAWLKSVDSIDLEEYIPRLNEVKKLVWVQEPYPHLIIDGLFIETYAEEIRSAFLRELAARGVSDETDGQKFTKIHDYDAYRWTPVPDLSGPFRVFFSREWYELFTKMSGLAFDENVMTAIHHHRIGSESGFVHTDFGKYAFRYAPIENQLNHWYLNSIYQSRGPKDDISEQQGVSLTRRSLALVYYLDKEEWSEGDGGETAFFSDPTGEKTVLKVPPIYNRLLVFPVEPKNYHAFVKNIVRERNTIIQWFHEPIDSIDKRLGFESHTH